MRSDLALYVIAVICLILAAVVFTTDYTGYPLMEPLIGMVTIAVLVILGAISAGAGYLIRPEEIMLAPPAQPQPPKPPSETCPADFVFLPRAVESVLPIIVASGTPSMSVSPNST